MTKTAKALFVLVLFSVVFLAFAFSGSAVAECWRYDGNESGCTSGNNSVVCRWQGPPQNSCFPKGCWDFTSNGTCTNASNTGLPCTWSAFGFCQELRCESFDGSNAATCQNNTIGLSCSWSNNEGGICDPAGFSCSNFNSRQSDCLNAPGCSWNPGTQNCTQAEGGFFGGGGGFEQFSPGCGIFRDAGTCGNMSGRCLWNTTTSQCTGVQSGLTCSDINASNKDLCNTIPVFPTCCESRGGVCNTTVSSTSCWDNMQEPPTGGNFCEDYVAVKNQTVCNQISGSPWYMPCKWSDRGTTSTSDDRCEFNSGEIFKGGGGFGHFEDISSQQTCEAAGGVWKTESVVNPDGSMNNDQWCEMNFGFGASSCDSSCWACEKQPTGNNWDTVAEAQTACESSDLGYCKWRNKTNYENPPNGQGFCEVPPQMATARCGSKASCEDYKFYQDPQAACNADTDCRWITESGNSYCASANTKTCSQSCGQCDTQTICQNNSNCQWDSQFNLCKSQGNQQSGSSSEICFNGEDDDGDDLIDCGDSNCVSDPFCGGATGTNCFQYVNNNTCLLNSSSSCVWITDQFTNQSWCDVKGSNCWQFDEQQAGCDAADGCNWQTNLGGDKDAFCDINETKFQGCFQTNNQSVCNTNANCTWNSGGFSGGPGDFIGSSDIGVAIPGGSSGFCSPKPFGCFNYFNNQSGCQADSFCSWVTDEFSFGGGRCEPRCFGKNASACALDSICKARTGFCEPEGFTAGGCFNLDGNQTACTAKDKCTWSPDPNYPGQGDDGWCNDAFAEQQFMGMQGGVPVILAEDTQGCGAGSTDAALADELDICGLGVKDTPDSYPFGVGVDNISSTALCNGKPLLGGGVGNGNKTLNIYLYLDSDGNATNGCAANDNSSQRGYEFFFKYESAWVSGELKEVKIAHTCKNISGTYAWGAAPIPVTSAPFVSCGDVGAPIIGLDKESLFGYTEFNKSANLRLYATTSNVSGNGSVVVDRVGPGYYTQGSVDFTIEDCFCPTCDNDGDGCTSSEDSDCSLINQFGFVPFEDCYNGLDDNFDGAVDCDDKFCAYDRFACSDSDGLVADENDNEPPSLASAQTKAMPDGAFVDLNTYEPSNASLLFYYNVSGCTTLNTTKVDSRYIPFHKFALDNFPGNPNRLGFSLAANRTYFYKYQLCDASGNCLLSACANFTTETNYDNCGKKCKTYLDPMSFTPPTNDSTRPLGNLTVRYDTDGDGVYDINKSYGESSTSKTLNETRNVNILIENPTSSTGWGIECINGTIPSTVNFNSSNLVVNDSRGMANETRVGMPSSEYSSKFITDFACKKIRITLPFNGTDLWHCANATGVGTSGCTNVTSNATLVRSTANSSTWQVDPSVLGFSYYGTTGSSSSGSSPGSSPGGGGSPLFLKGSTTTGTTFSKSLSNLEPGKTTTVSIAKSQIGMTAIKLEVTKKVNDASIGVERKLTKPADVTTASGKVYQYLTVSHARLVDADIKGVVIEFNVQRSWLLANAPGATIVLLRYDGKSWKELPTEKVNSDTNYLYYKATSPGLSTFAITTETVQPAATTPAPVSATPPPAAPQKPAATQPVTPTAPVATGQAVAQVPPPQSGGKIIKEVFTQPGPIFWVAAIAIIVVSLVIIFAGFRAKKPE